ncbi:MAG TPA: GNAT family N-acetyltransferase [Sphingomicrobium sp.]
MTDAAATYTVRDNPEKHRFEIDLGDGSLAVAEYTLPAGKIMFTHTEVPPAHEGKGLGTLLIRTALASARQRGLKVIPICPFVAAYIRKHAEEQDLLDRAWRMKFGLDPA